MTKEKNSQQIKNFSDPNKRDFENGYNFQSNISKGIRDHFGIIINGEHQKRYGVLKDRYEIIYDETHLRRSSRSERIQIFMKAHHLAKRVANANK